MSDEDASNNRDEELLKLAHEFKEHMLRTKTSFPDVSGKDIWDKLYYSGTLPSILKFFIARDQQIALAATIEVMEAEHALLYDCLPTGDVDAWELLKGLKRHLDGISQGINSRKTELATLKSKQKKDL